MAMLKGVLGYQCSHLPDLCCTPGPAGVWGRNGGDGPFVGTYPMDTQCGCGAVKMRMHYEPRGIWSCQCGNCNDFIFALEKEKDKYPKGDKFVSTRCGFAKGSNATAFFTWPDMEVIEGTDKLVHCGHKNGSPAHRFVCSQCATQVFYLGSPGGIFFNYNLFPPSFKQQNPIKMIVQATDESPDTLGDFGVEKSGEMSTKYPGIVVHADGFPLMGFILKQLCASPCTITPCGCCVTCDPSKIGICGPCMWINGRPYRGEFWEQYKKLCSSPTKDVQVMNIKPAPDQQTMDSEARPLVAAAAK
eukprot:TRINITY_DN22120_c0_g1_i1.p1 TRINITY_DN22120_c0_g1~~TRINITY_DN22120_c0_g1_i1.p1  ORF type:complete len:327 (-),score=43.27 TRINITY_DN22120_c0_g1_i1:261-1166(-)